VAWAVGGRDDETCRRLLAKTGIKGKIFLTDDWESYRNSLPREQHVIGKQFTVAIERDNSNARHYLARFRRRSKVTSRSDRMVDLSIRLNECLRHPFFFNKFRQQFICIFG
jgi:insertion element IS1 protein InsB